VIERNAFLKLLAENEDDVTARLVFADWLDENGEHEEADRHRRWPAAKEWLVKFCQANNPDPATDSETRPIPYEELMELGWTVAIRIDETAGSETGNEVLGYYCGNNYDMCCALRSGFAEFLANWSIVTGMPLPAEAEDNVHFRCGC
jgi:uncharacterized protein (TIGR02996 family)